MNLQTIPSETQIFENLTSNVSLSTLVKTYGKPALSAIIKGVITRHADYGNGRGEEYLGIVKIFVNVKDSKVTGFKLKADKLENLEILELAMDKILQTLEISHD